MQCAPQKLRRHKTCRQIMMGVGKGGGGRERSMMGVEQGVGGEVKVLSGACLAGKHQFAHQERFCLYILFLILILILILVQESTGLVLYRRRGLLLLGVRGRSADGKAANICPSRQICCRNRSVDGGVGGEGGSRWS
jgi:hypothetical protein